MLHFSCDHCGKEIHPNSHQRYVVKIEAFAANDPAEITDADLDEDHLEAISQLLQETELECDPPETNKNFRYDLCCDCYEKYVDDPLNREMTQKFDFSKN